MQPAPLAFAILKKVKRVKSIGKLWRRRTGGSDPKSEPDWDAPLDALDIQYRGLRVESFLELSAGIRRGSSSTMQRQGEGGTV
jgi:hypothetical protein